MGIAVQTIPEENRKLLTYHDSWAYWADRYDLTVIGAIQPSDFAEPSAQRGGGPHRPGEGRRHPGHLRLGGLPERRARTDRRRDGCANTSTTCATTTCPGEPGDDRHSYIGLMVQNMEIMIPALGGDADADGACRDRPGFRRRREHGEVSAVRLRCSILSRTKRKRRGSSSSSAGRPAATTAHRRSATST